MNRKSDKYRFIVDYFSEAQPDVASELNYGNAYELLVSTMLAAQCTDARVNEVTPALFARWPSPDALAEADPGEVETIVRPCGLGRSKARDIVACMRTPRDEYGGRVPDTMEALLRLPGVGRKSANLILGDV